jgi:hypothetical protein
LLKAIATLAGALLFMLGAPGPAGADDFPNDFLNDNANCRGDTVYNFAHQGVQGEDTKEQATENPGGRAFGQAVAGNASTNCGRG